MKFQVLYFLVVCTILINATQQFPINTMDITSINSLSQTSSESPHIDPKIRTALFNVLSRLERRSNRTTVEEEEEVNDDNNTYVSGYEYRPTSTSIASTAGTGNSGITDEDHQRFDTTTTTDRDDKYIVYGPTKRPDDEDDRKEELVRWEYISNGTIQQFDVDEVINRNRDRNNVSSVTSDGRENKGIDQDHSKDEDNVVNPFEQEALFNQLKQQLINRLKQNGAPIIASGGKKTTATANSIIGNQNREVKVLDDVQSSRLSASGESLKSEESAGMYGGVGAGAGAENGGESLLNFVKLMMAAQQNDRNRSDSDELKKQYNNNNNNNDNNNNNNNNNNYNDNNNNDNRLEVQQVQSNKRITSKKDGDEKSAVEIHKAPLVAAFTLEQDQYGLPKRVIPLDSFSKTYLESMTQRLTQEIAKSSFDSDTTATRGRDVVDSDVKPRLELFLGTDKTETQRDIEERLKEIFKKKQELETEKRKYLLELERRRKINKPKDEIRQFMPTPATAAFPFNSPSQLFSSSAGGAAPFPSSNEKEQHFVDFQKSVEFPPSAVAASAVAANGGEKSNYVEFMPSVSNYLEYPPSPPSPVFSEFSPSSRLHSKPPISQFPLYRPNRNEPSKFVGNFEYPLVKPEIYDFDTQHPSFGSSSNIVWRKPDIVDRQLQSLIYQSGIPKSGKFDDINIVSKVLSLDHHNGYGIDHGGNTGGNGHRIKYRDSVFAESSAPPNYFYPQIYAPSYKLAMSPPSFATFKRGKK